MAILGLVSGPTFAEAVNKGPALNLPRKLGERIEKPKAFSEQSPDTNSMVEWQAILKEQMAWQQQRVFENLRRQLRISDEEWTVIKPRLQAVYDLVHPQPQMGPGNARPTTEIEQRSRDLRELLRDEKAPADQIKAKLTAYRAAREKTAQELIRARQSLRLLVTLRQEAVLVLNGLLD
ncbi:MAG: hypothetical protein A2Y76_09525 [Planctomycetes bacterium RBG_13_60_9]|nr:MAG: hypothetical protein A2Y76_09525 [Planctomycetes bacterium RBG_13_60_9]